MVITTIRFVAVTVKLSLQQYWFAEAILTKRVVATKSFSPCCCRSVEVLVKLMTITFRRRLLYFSKLIFRNQKISILSPSNIASSRGQIKPEIFFLYQL